MKSTTAIYSKGVQMALALTVIATAPAHAADCTTGSCNCGDTLVAGSKVVFDGTEGIVAAVCGTDPALTIGSGASLDLNGETIECDGTFNGIELSGEKVTLKNGAVTGCVGGVLLEGSKHKITSVVSKGNTSDGFRSSAGVSGVKFTNTSAVDNGGIGYSLGSPSNKNKLTGAIATGNSQSFVVEGNQNKFSECAVSNNNSGIIVVGNKNNFARNTASANVGNITVVGDENKLTQNTATGSSSGTGIIVSGNSNKLSKNAAEDNGGKGFDVTGNENKLTKNIAVDNNTRGFEIEGSDNQLTKCAAASNGSEGIIILSGTGNRVKGSRAENNGFDGILVGNGATPTTISKNVSLQNGADDLKDINAGCAAGANVWSKNIFGTSEDGGANCIQ